MIGGVGVDLVDIARIGAVLERSERFARRVFTIGERRHGAGRRIPAGHLAACFAAKEAFLKAIGIGLWGGVPLRQIEVVQAADGRHHLKLGPLAEQALRRAGGNAATLGLSRERRVAVAVVVVQ
jgi:holo-[acyl-carrier protein] synthase